MKFKHLRTAALVTLVAAVPLAAQDAPSALVLQVQGDVRLLRGAAPPVAAAIGARLAAGDGVLPGEGSHAILLTATGAPQVVTQATTVQAPLGAGNAGLFDRAVARLAQAESTEAGDLDDPQEMIRPVPGEATLVAPRNGLTVTTGHPTFSWMGVAGKDSYTIQIRNVDGGRPRRFQVTGATFTLPGDSEALEPGATYAWTVAPDEGRAAREVQFKVIGSDEAGELDAILAEVSELGLDPRGDGAFLAAIIYRDLDLFYDAADALASVENAADLSTELYLLKGEILAVLGHADEARTAFDRAEASMR